MSAAIARTLLLARDAPSADDMRVFPAAEWFKDALPTKGRALRRTYRTVAADLGVNPIFTTLLMGRPLGANLDEKYINKLMLTGGGGLRGAQRAISKKIVALWGV